MCMHIYQNAHKGCLSPYLSSRFTPTGHHEWLTLHSDELLKARAALKLYGQNLRWLIYVFKFPCNGCIFFSHCYPLSGFGDNENNKIYFCTTRNICFYSSLLAFSEVNSYPIHSAAISDSQNTAKQSMHIRMQKDEWYGLVCASGYVLCLKSQVISISKKSQESKNSSRKT